MKRKICLTAMAVAIVCALICFVGCTETGAVTDTINSALKQSYSHVTVNVTSIRDDVTLNGTYNISFADGGATVEYSFDKLNELSLDGNNQNGYITRVNGTVTVIDGKLMESDFSEELDVDELAYTGFTFKQAFFDNIKAGRSTFRADVTNPKGFVGNGLFVCNDMHVEAVLSGKLLSKLELTYLSENGFDTTVTYLFSTETAA